MALESDNSNADGRLAVQFYKRVEEDKAATAAEGRTICKEVDYVKIQVAGDSLNEIDRAVYESDKLRFPTLWAKYLNRVNEEGRFEGTPLTEWTLISRSQAEQLRYLKFHTVESIANASDLQIQALGMAAGMAPHTFRDKAKNFLDSAKSTADFDKRQEELDQLRAENAKIKAETEAKMEAMRAESDAKFASLLAAVGEKKPRSKKAETVEE